MEKNTIDADRPLLTITVGEFQNIIREAICGRREEDGATAKGLGELAERLGCGKTKISELRRLGVLDKAIVSKIGREVIFDVSEARKLASEYGKNNKH